MLCGFSFTVLGNTEIRLQAGWSRVQIPGGTRNYFDLHNAESGSVAHPFNYSVGSVWGTAATHFHLAPSLRMRLLLYAFVVQ
jgi:hypothetical protein